MESGEGRRSPSPVWGSGGIAQKILKFNSANLFIFFHDFKTEIALPSVVFSFIMASCHIVYGRPYCNDAKEGVGGITPPKLNRGG